MDPVLEEVLCGWAKEHGFTVWPEGKSRHLRKGEGATLICVYPATIPNVLMVDTGRRVREVPISGGRRALLDALLEY